MDGSVNITVDLIERASSISCEPALILRGRDVSFSELNDVVWFVSANIREAGVRPGDVVGIFAESDYTLVVTMLALARLGAVVVSIPKSMTEFQRGQLVSRAKVNKIILDAQRSWAAPVEMIPFDPAWMEKRSYPESLLEIRPRSPWIVISGSGSTGEPKLIPITHGAQRVRNHSCKDWLRLGAGDRVASLTHFDFTHPKNRLLESLAWGAAYHVNDSTRVDILRMCETQRITVLHATVFHVQALLRVLPKGCSGMLGGLRVLAMSASTINDRLRSDIRAVLTERLLVRYASNETGTISCVRAPEVFDRRGTVGVPLPGVSVAIFDETRESFLSNGVGHIGISCSANFDGYLSDPSANSERFRKTWFFPGDLGELAADGHVIFHGRADDMMIYNGINIYPAEVERVLGDHAGVADVACLPLPHPQHQDVPVAVVALVADGHADEAERLAYCRERLGVRAPWRVFLMSTIPRNERGKLLKPRLLSDLVALLRQQS